MPPHGTCPVCRRTISLTVTRKIGHHGNGRTSIVDPRRGQRCEGAGESPATEK
ncbi:hypothetical protein SUDANB9_06532 [Streptomyces sp. enrichment culture]